MTLFLLSVAVVLAVSAICSLSEAALYSIRMPYVRELADTGSRAGKILEGFKRNMEQPITAILIVNTAANTAGAAVAGAQARLLFGELALFWFSAIFTLCVLFFSEILPKIAGVTYRRSVARAVSVPLDMVVRSLHPLVWLSRQAARVLKTDEEQALAPEAEVHQIAALSAEEGSILPIEAELVKNVLRLNEVQARDIMTPRTVVFKLAAERTVREVADGLASAHSRIPIFAGDDPEDLIGWVLRADVLTRLAAGEDDIDVDVPLSALAKPLGFVPEAAPGHLLLNEFLKRRTHILAVADEYGGVAGIVTLEDVLESLLGEEIVDETDSVVDLRKAALEQGRTRLARPSRGAPSASGPTPPEDEADEEETP